MSYVGGTICILPRTGSGNVFRWLNSLWGDVGGIGVVLGLGASGELSVRGGDFVVINYFLRGGVFAFEGLCLPSMWTRFCWFLMHFGVGFVDLLSQKEKRKPIAVYSIDFSKKIGKVTILNFNWLFVKLNRFICN
jgi:hypothetical protein